MRLMRSVRSVPKNRDHDNTVKSKKSAHKEGNMDLPRFIAVFLFLQEEEWLCFSYTCAFLLAGRIHHRHFLFYGPLRIRTIIYQVNLFLLLSMFSKKNVRRKEPLKNTVVQEWYNGIGVVHNACLCHAKFHANPHSRREFVREQSL